MSRCQRRGNTSRAYSSAASFETTSPVIGRFATACRRAVADAISFEQRAEQIETEWRDRLGRIRARSATDLLLHALLGAPVLTVTTASELVGRSFPQTNEAISRLVQAGILSR
jgi:hypothetical protein